MARGGAELWEEARPRALAQVAVLEDAVAALLVGALADAQRDAARREAHRLTGSLGSLAVPRGSVIAGELERRLEVAPALAEAPELAERVLALRREIESAQGPQDDADDGDRLPRVALAGLDGARAGALLRAGSGHEWRLTAAAAPPEPGVADVVLLGGRAPDLPEQVARQSKGGAVVAVLLEDAAIDRVELIRRGARRLVPPALAPAAVIAELAELESGRHGRGATVLAVDDDPIVLALLDAALRRAGHELVPCSEAGAFWSALEASRPDLVVLDLQLGEVDGTDLCRALRADPRWRALPVLFLTAATGGREIAELFAAGGDDYVPKPVDAAELSARIGGRLERTRQLLAAAEEDDRTGLLRRAALEPELERAVAVAQRLRQPLALAAIAADEEGADAAALRHAGAAVRRGLAPGDVAGRWNETDIVVGMLGLDAHEAGERLGRLLEDARGAADGATLSAGVAEHPRDGEDPATLAGAALAARRLARAAGGDRVLAAGAEEGESTIVDVVVVEDDDVMASLVLHALETRGYRTRRLADGDEAARLLGGPRPALRAQLILLDWDLPARDGLTVLRGLAADGVLRATKVVMLTLHASEREVLASLELGATDHVAKPFSVAVLMQRVRRVLAR
jgi:DNA-binding response OmpR family regulator/HPt (histidine-containing phosphotransfer) domain-containing protein